MNVILTGATGMVGEGVLLQCLADDRVKQVLSVSRNPSGLQHQKLKEFIISDFFAITPAEKSLVGYDACFFCSGVSAVGMSEEDYTRVTLDLTVHFAKVLLELNPGMVFNYVSGAGTSPGSKLMWARVKGNTEILLQKMAFKSVYCFRPGVMKPMKEQIRVKSTNKVLSVLFPVMSLIFPSCTIREVGLAMIRVSLNGYSPNILNSRDIRKVAKM